jgi:hypothetical protein
MGKDKHAGGRPPKYKKQNCEQARKLCLLGYTDIQLADFFEVAESTIHKWKLDHPEFSESIKKGKVIADGNVADSLYNRALGYSHPDTHISNYQGEIIITDITKHYPPDTAAAFIWLKNRASWKDKQDINHSVDNSVLESLEKLYDSK